MRGEPLELFRQTAGGRSRQIRLAAEVLVDPVARDPWGSEVKLRQTRLRYEVTLERRTLKPGIERVQVSHESVYPIMKKADRWVKWMKPSRAFRAASLKYGRQPPWLTTEASDEVLSFSVYPDGGARRLVRQRPAGAAEATVLSSITTAEYPHLFALREEMRHWRLLQLDPALLRRPVPATAADVLAADGSNLAAVLVRLKDETATEARPSGILNDIAAELNSLIPGISRLDAQFHEASREYRIELTMRDGLPFSSRVISDGTLRVLALLTLLHDPRQRGLTCFEEPENGVQPARIKQLLQRLRDLVTDPKGVTEDDETPPLTQLLLNSHSPVVLSALVDKTLSPVQGSILFADTATVSDPERKEQRRRTRLRPVESDDQLRLFSDDNESPNFVSSFEVKRVLETVNTEG